jgi:hypothetical protein
MGAKQIDVTCPCCASVLTIDVLTSKVMRTVRAEEHAGGAPAADRWDKAQERVRERTKQSADKLESALEDERTKESRFEDLFKKAREKHAPKPEDTD